MADDLIFFRLTDLGYPSALALRVAQTPAFTVVRAPDYRSCQAGWSIYCAVQDHEFEVRDRLAEQGVL